MAKSSWGTVTDSAGGGGGDANVLKIDEQTRVRVVDSEPRRWRQHAIEGSDGKFKGVVCPKGPDGRGNAECPLCMKPVARDEEGEIVQLFPVSRRHAVNVYDYGSDSVKVLIGGPQIFKEIDQVAKLGLDPLECDFHIAKAGRNRDTSYTVVRGSSDPLPRDIGPDDLHPLDKYDEPSSVESIFQQLAERGIDWDEIRVPQLELDEAEATEVPWGKHKGLTVGEIWAVDPDYLEYMCGLKRADGVYDKIMLAMHAVLLHHGATTPLPVHDGVTKDSLVNGAPKRERPAPEPAAPPEPAPKDDDKVTLYGPDGAVEVPAVAADSLIATGAFTKDPPVEAAEPDPEPESEKTAELPDDDDEIQFHLNVTNTAVPMSFKDGRRLALKGEGHFVDEALRALVEADDRDDRGVAASVAAEAPDARPEPGDDPLDPALAHQRDEDGRWVHPALPGKDYASKGPITQALNKQKNGGGKPAAESKPRADEQERPILGEVREMITARQSHWADFNKLKELIAQASGSRVTKVPDLSDDELGKLKTLLEAIEVDG